MEEFWFYGIIIYMATGQTFTKDGIPLKIGQIPKPENMYFYERSDGSVIRLSEKDAAKVHSKFKFLGMSDGMIYFNKLKELQQNFQNLTMGEIQEAMRQAERDEIECARGNMKIPQLQALNLNLPEQIKKGRDTIN